MTQQESEVIIARLKAEKTEAVSVSLALRMKKEKELDEQFDAAMRNIRVRRATMKEKAVTLRDKCNETKGTDGWPSVRMELEILHGDLNELRAEEQRINRDYRRSLKELDFAYRSNLSKASVDYREKLSEVMNEVIQSKRPAV